MYLGLQEKLEAREPFEIDLYFGSTRNRLEKNEPSMNSLCNPIKKQLDLEQTLARCTLKGSGIIYFLIDN